MPSKPDSSLHEKDKNETADPLRMGFIVYVVVEFVVIVVFIITYLRR
jgi:heme/copper-type cytochrome/quinol oxidase subunit 3